MNTNRIYKCLAQVLDQDIRNIQSLQPDVVLTTIGLDSLSFIQFIVAIEEEFSITVLDSDLLFSNFDTLNNVKETIKKYIISDELLKKCLVIDCDNVLWEGVAADDGIENIIFSNSAIKLQNAIAKLYERGVLICLCSKNDLHTVDTIFEKYSFMPLKKDHIILSKINWNNKAENIIEIAQELSISLDSLVFVDDSDYEIGLIDTVVPQVKTIKADLCSGSFIDEINSVFSSYTNIDEDLNRTKLYKQQKERETIKLHSKTIEEYNSSLKSQTFIKRADVSVLNRLAELSQRTNQFNLSQSRYTVHELKELCDCPDYELLYLRASDKYGDMGIVAACVISLSTHYAIIESFMVSCRVFGRGFEYELLNKIKQTVGRLKLLGVYCETNKNKRFNSFFPDNGVKIYE